jgi:hypothetical protein
VRKLTGTIPILIGLTGLSGLPLSTLNSTPFILSIVSIGNQQRIISIRGIKIAPMANPHLPTRKHLTIPTIHIIAKAINLNIDITTPIIL